VLPRSKPAVVGLAALVGFIVVAAARSPPAFPGARQPSSNRLTDLIAREQAASAQLRRQAAQLRRQLDAERLAGTGGPGTAVARAVGQAENQAGLTPTVGPGLRVTLDDSTLARTASGDVNDLVIHSQDVQAAVNALWRAGAEAMAVNGQRVVGTSAVLCVGNTLLLDGTVHSPPYVISAIGADRAGFDGDPLVRRLRHDADLVHLGFSVERVGQLQVPGFPGPIVARYATPLS
jgi:uncharacterized protein YlxW (UPF0749 family)